MTTTSAPHPAVVALPARAVSTEEWQTFDGRFYRCFQGEERQLGDSTRVWAHGSQWDDGSIEDGTTKAGAVRGSRVSVEGDSWEDALSVETAQRLTDLLVTAVDGLDGWTAR